jgi:hypothetical protein
MDMQGIIARVQVIPIDAGRKSATRITDPSSSGVEAKTTFSLESMPATNFSGPKLAQEVTIGVTRV